MSAVAHIEEYKTGRFYTDEFRGDRSWNGYEHNVLLRNEGTGADGVPRYTDVAMALGVDDLRDGRGLAVADFDNDGDLDLAVNNNPYDTGGTGRSSPQLLLNEIGATRSWLALELQGTSANRDAIGAVVRIETSEGRQMRHVVMGSSYASQHTSRLYFGLNEVSRVDAIAVDWPGGGSDRFEGVGARQLVRVTEGSGMETFPLGDGRTAMR